ncbi:PREDICTED: translation initiation factor IF-2-like [Chinchilla lanigera]|uniref:translation initiation factor IF-2-like n=1 Tax=Chinchilla lanigera TaxID=34839 RepID=UPI00038EC6CC|nr:PREDICTED: translation initiation factor IF-2-like [Chinchilla lanigera]
MGSFRFPFLKTQAAGFLLPPPSCRSARLSAAAGSLHRSRTGAPAAAPPARPAPFLSALLLPVFLSSSLPIRASLLSQLPPLPPSCLSSPEQQEGGTKQTWLPRHRTQGIARFEISQWKPGKRKTWHAPRGGAGKGPSRVHPFPAGQAAAARNTLDPIKGAGQGARSTQQRAPPRAVPCACAVRTAPRPRPRCPSRQPPSAGRPAPPRPRA